MLFTDSGWQETKLGRVFVAQPEGKTCLRPQIECSEYVARRGHYSGFTLAFEQLLPPLSPAQKVFVSDGAEWIAHWLSAAYTDAIHILDYFHVVEKLAVVAKGLPHGSKWLATQQGYLLNNQSEQVEKNVASLSLLAVDERDRLVGYLLNNRHRMRYGDYRKQGLLIGSGPIEAAHRTVLQPGRRSGTDEAFRATLGEFGL